MVTIVGGPSESKLREVAGAKHHSTLLIGHIHQNLSPFAGLTILICDILDLRVVTDILEMQFDSWADRNLAECHPEGIHKGQRV